MNAKPKRIIVDARPLAWPGTGNATYLYRMLKALIKMRREYDWVLISHRGVHASFSDILLNNNVEMHISQGLLAKAGPIWMHFLVPKIIKSLNGDLFWATLALLPFHYKKRVKTPNMVNFHDLNAWVAPKTMKIWNRWQHKIWSRSSANQADAVLCLSNTTKQDILKYFPNIDKNKLHVVYPGYEPGLDAKSQKPKEPIASLSAFFLCVGTIEPRKNQKTLIEAYKLAQKENELPALLFVGRRGWGDSQIYDTLKSGVLNQNNIYFLENANNLELQWCYENCLVIVMPSLHEGFGLPVLEANSFQKLALLSDIPIFREIGKNHLFAPALDVHAWSQLLIDACKAHQNGNLKSLPFDLEFWSHPKRAQKIDDVISGILSLS